MIYTVAGIDFWIIRELAMLCRLKLIFITTQDNFLIEEKSKRINNIHVNVKRQAEKVIEWLENRKVILIGEFNETRRFKYIDHRTIEEKMPTE